MKLNELEKRLNELIDEREQFQIAANQELAFYNGRIKELQSVIYLMSGDGDNEGENDD